MKIQTTKQITQKTLIFALTLLVVGLAGVTNLIAQNNLDLTFGNGGKVITDVGGVDFANDLVLQPDGKFIAAGQANLNFAVVRYHGNGSLDASFGSGGKVITDFGGSDAAFAVALQPDGKIIAAGVSSNSNFALARYNADGSLDSTFGSGGRLTTDFFGFSDSAQAVIIQTDGKIVAAGIVRTAGSESSGNFGLARYNADGSLDTAFGSGGKVSTDFNGQLDVAYALVLQADGKLAAAGAITQSNSFYFGLARYNTDGSLDSTFGSGGKVVTCQCGRTSEGVLALIVQADGKLVAAGVQDGFDGDSYFLLARFNTNGTLDTTFGNGGHVSTVFGLSGSFSGLALQADGRIVAAGNVFINGNYDFGLVRYNPNGTLDTTFGTGGKISTDFGGEDAVQGIVIQPDGKIAAAGYSGNANSNAYDFVLARYPGDSVVARRTPFDFDGDGKADISVFRPSDRVWYLNRSTQGFSATQFGLSSDKITPADYDGDGKTDFAVYRPSEGIWYILQSSGGFKAVRFGVSADIPTAADFDGDGKADIAVFRPETGVWYFLYSSDNSTAAFQFGLNGDLPTVGDYDGDGKSDIAVFRPADGVWYLQRSSAGFTAFQFGIASDKPTPADYDGDGRTDIAVYRPSEGNWYLQRSAAGFGVVNFGIGEDIPAAGDYDGDGKTDVAVFRPSTGVWWLLQTTSGLTTTQFGQSGDTPVPAGYLP